MASACVLQPRVFLGRLFINAATSLGQVWLASLGLRDECLTEEIFDSPADARRALAFWRSNYNNVRPHSSNKSPAEA